MGLRCRWDLLKVFQHNTYKSDTCTAIPKVSFQKAAVQYCVVHLLSEGVPSREDASTSWPSTSGLQGHRRTCLTILESGDRALELDGQDVEASSREDSPSSSR
jgi:hypothetical protein